VVVTATAPAAFMKFLREYSMFKPPYGATAIADRNLIGAKRNGQAGVRAIQKTNPENVAPQALTRVG
jgi:hypothetical protein